MTVNGNHHCGYLDTRPHAENLQMASLSCLYNIPFMAFTQIKMAGSNLGSDTFKTWDDVAAYFSRLGGQ